MNYREYCERLEQLLSRGRELQARGDDDGVLMVLAEVFETIRKFGPDATRGRNLARQRVIQWERVRQIAWILKAIERKGLGSKKVWQ